MSKKLFLRREQILLFASFFFLIGASLFAQEEKGKLVHYQKKITLVDFIFPNNNYEAETFNIIFPDSIYNNGEIKIKKAKINSVKVKNLKLYFFGENYTQVIYNIKKKDSKVFEERLNQQKEVCNFKTEIIRLGFRNKYIITLTD